MEAIRALWPNVVVGVDNVNEIFQTKVIPHLVSGRSVETLVARYDKHKQALETTRSILSNIQFAIIVLIILTVEYTLYNIFPTLAIVEDEAPPYYVAVVSKDTVVLEGPDGVKTAHVDEESILVAKPITSGLRSIYGLLRSIDGKKSLFRGVFCFVASKVALFITTFFISLLLPVVVALPLASLLIAPLSTAWTHIIITQPSEKRFWRRLPPFGLTVRATALPSVILYLVTGLQNKFVPSAILAILGPAVDPRDLRVWLLQISLVLFTWAFVAVPAHAVLVRVQASMLPEEEQTIVPLDRGLTLHRVEGREYMSVLNAWRSFSRAAWARLIKLYGKAFLFCLAVGAIVAVIAVFELIFIAPLFQ
ncbi:hypothetical protein F4804DRAFT_307208 [Jackrogersella minutella]|nr:hypothetical protein F4804DRAFT_307208 [Jackrogersella minutella]